MTRRRYLYCASALALVAFFATVLSLPAVPHAQEPVRAVVKQAARPSRAAPPPAPAEDKPLRVADVPIPGAPVKESPPAPAVKRDPTKPWLTPGLELSAPQKRTRPGLAFITAKVDAPPDAKVEMLWKVESSWEDEGLVSEVVIEKRDGARRIQIVIPDGNGTVRAFAWAIISGKATSEDAAETSIEMTYAPRSGGLAGKETRGTGTPPEVKPSSPSAPAPSAPRVDVNKVVDVYFVIDVDKGDATVNALVGTVGMRNRLRALGITPHTIDAPSAEGRAAIERLKIQTMINDAGGVPALIAVNANRKVVRSPVTIPATIEGVVEALK